MSILKQYQEVKDSFREYFIRYLMGEDFEESDLHDVDTYWIGWGSTLAINDYYVSFEDIKDIIEYSIPLDTWHDWYNYCLDDEYINLMSYVNIRQAWTHEDFVKFQEEQDRLRETPEYQAETEKRLQEIKDEFIKNIS